MEAEVTLNHVAEVQSTLPNIYNEVLYEKRHVCGFVPICCGHQLGGTRALFS